MQNTSDNPGLPGQSVFSSLIHSLPLQLYVKDRDGRFLMANTAYCQRLGLDQESLVGKNDYDIHPADLAEKYLQDDQRIMETGETEHIEEKWQSLAGHESWVQVIKTPLRNPGDETVVGTVGIFWDITDRKQSEIALADERSLLRTLIDNLPAYIYVKDQERRFMVANRSVAELIGVGDPSALLGRRDEEFFPKEQVDKFVADEQDVLRSGGPVKDTEENVTDGQGDNHWVRTSKVPLKNIDGEIVGIIGIGHDITSQKRAERERARLEQQLRHAQRMETIGTLTAGIAHDFNNLLSVINGYAELMMATTPTEHKHHETLGKVLNAGRTAASLVGQLLAFSRKQAAHARVIQLNDELNAGKTRWTGACGNNISINMELDEDLWLVRIDPAQFEQVVVNILENGRDAMSGEGELIIRTGNIANDRYGGHQNFTGLPPGEWVFVSIEDTGEGMSKEVQERVFEPFFTTKDKGKGTGLGMATVFGIVKQNKGHLIVQSHPGRGTTVSVFLPRTVADDAEQRVTSADENGDSDYSGTETILVVDDDPSVCKLTETILLEHGYTVHTAVNGAEGLFAVERYGDALDLLLTDVVMAGMSGKMLADQVTRKRPGLRVLFMSGYSGDEISTYGILNPGIDCLAKPFSAQDLLGKVRAVLDK